MQINVFVLAYVNRVDNNVSNYNLFCDIFLSLFLSLSRRTRFIRFWRKETVETKENCSIAWTN